MVLGLDFSNDIGLMFMVVIFAGILLSAVLLGLMHFGSDMVERARAAKGLKAGCDLESSVCEKDLSEAVASH